MALPHHMADLVGAGLHALLGNHLADRVGNLADTGLANVLDAIDLLLADFRNPRAAALARVAALAAIAAAGPRTAGNGSRLPVAAAAPHGLRAVHRLAHRVAFLALAVLVNPLADGVKTVPCASFIESDPPQASAREWLQL